jgi:hypothetical protein
MKFDVLTAADVKMAVFWDLAQRSLVEVYRCLRGTFAFTIRAVGLAGSSSESSVNFTGLHGATIRNTAIFAFYEIIC